jgi:hypothetical protein
LPTKTCTYLSPYICYMHHSSISSCGQMSTLY